MLPIQVRIPRPERLKSSDPTGAVAYVACTVQSQNLSELLAITIKGLYVPVRQYAETIGKHHLTRIRNIKVKIAEDSGSDHRP